MHRARLTGPVGLALLEESPQALLALGRRAPLGDAGRGHVANVLGLTARHVAHERLRRGDGPRRRLQQLAHALVDGGVELALGHDAVDEADRERPCRRRTARRSGTARARRNARSSRRTNGEMTAGTRPRRTSVKPNCAPAAATATSATATSPAPPAERRALHAGDDGLRRAVDRLEEGHQRAGVGKVLLAVEARRPSSSTRRRRRRRTRRRGPPRTMTRTSSRAEAAATASRSARTIAPSKALRTLGPRRGPAARPAPSSDKSTRGSCICGQYGTVVSGWRLVFPGIPHATGGRSAARSRARPAPRRR